MAHHASAIKKIRQITVRRLRNRYQMKTTRNLIKTLRLSHDKAKAMELLKTVSSNVDKLAKKGVIHKNNAANKKARLARLINKMA